MMLHDADRSNQIVYVFIVFKLLVLNKVRVSVLIKLERATLIQISIIPIIIFIFIFMSYVQAAEDVEIDKFFLLHVVGQKNNADAMTIKQEITGIQKVLKKKSLDVISIDLQSMSKLKSMNNSGLLSNNPENPTKILESNTKNGSGSGSGSGREIKTLSEILSETGNGIECEREDDLFTTNMASFLSHKFTDISEYCNENTELGIDLSTEWLSDIGGGGVGVREKELLLLLNSIDKYNNSVNSSVSSTDSSSSSENNNRSENNTSSGSNSNNENSNNENSSSSSSRRKISCLTVATNSFTNHNILLINQWAAKSG